LKVKIEKRTYTSEGKTYLFYIIFLATGLFFSSLLFLTRGINPFRALYGIIIGSFGSFYGLKETIAKAIPLILCGTGLVIAFKGKFWNIGAEGQLLLGAVAATYIALKFGGSGSRPFVLTLMFLAGFAGGAIWGIITVILKIKFGVNEIISTLMLNYIAANFVQFLVFGPWKGRTQYGFPYTDNFQPAATLPLIKGSRIHYLTLIIAILLSIASFFFINRTRYGYETKVLGENPDAAKYSGINFLKTMVLIMILSGGFAGIAGVGEVAGIHHHLTFPDQISAGYGYTAIIVAWLSRLNPLFVLLSALFFGGILIGGDIIQTSLGLPFATINIFNGLILLFVLLGTFLMEYKVSIIREKI